MIIKVIPISIQKSSLFYWCLSFCLFYGLKIWFHLQKIFKDNQK